MKAAAGLLVACVCLLSAPADLRADEHLSAREQANLRLIEPIHAPGTGLITRLRESGLLAEDAEWWVAGPPELLPFAGSFRGLDGVAEFQRRLAATLRYDSIELQRYLVSGDEVVAVFTGRGVGRASGRPFESEILRFYTLREGRIVRVRTYYDTAAYVAAVAGDKEE